MSLKNSFLILFLLLIFSCQPRDSFNPIVFDNSVLEKFSISSKNILIKDFYNPTFSETNIENQINIVPIVRLKNWLNSNFVTIGNENKLIINILDASITRVEIENFDAKKYEDKFIYSYKISYLLEFELFDNTDFLIANTLVKSIRTTTSSKFISLNELEYITDELTLFALKDLSRESKLQLSNYMNEYLLD